MILWRRSICETEGRADGPTGGVRSLVATAPARGEDEGGLVHADMPPGQSASEAAGALQQVKMRHGIDGDRAHCPDLPILSAKVLHGGGAGNAQRDCCPRNRMNSSISTVLAKTSTVAFRAPEGAT